MVGADFDDFGDDDYGKELGDGRGYDDDFLGGDYLGDYGVGGLTPMEKHSDLLKELTNFGPYITDTINSWLCLMWNDKEQKYEHMKGTTPIMNIHCAKWCAGFLKTYARGNNIITTMREYDYSLIMRDVIEVAWLNIGCRAEEFGIKNTGDIYRVCVELEHAAMLVLMGAGEGMYNKLLTSTTTRSENVMVRDEMMQRALTNQTQQQQQPSLFQKFKRLWKAN